MRTLYIECNMGAAGDMLTAALLELMPDIDETLHKINAFGIQNVETKATKAQKCGITGTNLQVLVNHKEEESHDFFHHHREHHHTSEITTHEHEHHSLHDIYHQIDHLHMKDEVKKDVKEVYRLIAEAESQVHGKTVQEIHFHEVGTMDALADVTAVCYLLRELQVDRIVCSPIHVGSGNVHCAHGILPVPAPATALLLQGIPTYSDGLIQGELCTPTGAALLKYFVQEFGPQPVMRVEKTGYGCGKKDFPKANVVRVMLGETQEQADAIIELSCNMDDCTPENIAFAMEELFLAGALDVYTIPVTTKKNRQGVLFTCMCRLEDRERMIKLIFQHTTTLGIREHFANRYTMKRTMDEIETPYGKVHVKKASGYGITRSKAEYEDLAKIAREQGMSIEQVREYCRENV